MKSIKNRRTNTREYKKVITIFTEGESTEKIYFEKLKLTQRSVSLCIKPGNKKTAPRQILSRAKDYIKKDELKHNEQIWLVIDVDNRPESDFKELKNWENSSSKRLAISNPCFEFWLLLHFEPGYKVANSSNCQEKLKKYMPDYTKSHINEKIFSDDKYKFAIANGESKEKNISSIFEDAHSTVYQLMKEILEPLIEAA